MLLAFFIIALVFSCNKKDFPVSENNNDANFISADKAISLAAATISGDKSPIMSKDIVVKNNKVVKSTEAIKAKDGLNAFYIINFEGGGFTIISADKRTQPTLAYSPTGVFKTTNMPLGLQSWLETTKNGIEGIRREKIVYKGQDQIDFFKGIKNQGANVNRLAPPPPGDNPCQDVEEIVWPLLQTQWGQEDGYNNYMPLLSCGPNGRAYTGCTATAMAQIMRHHQYPNGYNYSAMPNIVFSSSTTGANDIAQLMYDAAASVPYGSPYYDCSGTWGAPAQVDDAFGSVFGYVGTGFWYSYTGSSTNLGKIYGSLNQSRPVLFTGGGGSSGTVSHAWVCDGYMRTIIKVDQGDGSCVEHEGWSLHMNWGWNGYNDAWFAVNNFTTSGGNYFYDNWILTGINPFALSY